jgi:hypothetical protein
MKQGMPYDGIMLESEDKLGCRERPGAYPSDGRLDETHRRVESATGLFVLVKICGRRHTDRPPLIVGKLV